MENMIGNTPLIKIKYKFKNEIKSIYVKLEYYNLTGSIKDRMAEYIITEGYKAGLLKEGMPIIEATSGNTGISLSAIGAYYNNPVYIFMPDWCSDERKRLIELYGGKLVLVSKEEGGFITCIKKAEELAKTMNGFRTDQFANQNNIEVHYKSTGKEIVDKLKGKEIGGFISGIGTGGTLMGVGKRLKEINKDIIIGALEPDKLPILSQGVSCGSHKIEGIGDEFIPDLVDRSIIDEVIVIDDEDAINMSRYLSKELGIGVGISSGANMLGAVLLQEKINKEVVTIFADDNKKYLSTELVKPINRDTNFISNKIELISYEAVN